MVEQIEEPQDPIFKWLFYEEDDDLETLIVTLNIKGIREKKLQDNLRRVQARSKLKKTNKRNTNPSKLTTPQQDSVVK